MIAMHRLLTAFPMALVFVLPACDYGDGSLAEELIPDTVSENLRQVNVSARERVEINAERVETYKEEDYTVFIDARMTGMDHEGISKMEGRADRIELQGNGDGSASGGIVIQDLVDEFRLEASELAWKDAERLLTGESGVSVELDDGITISGENFQADLARKTYIFTSGVEGTLEFDDD